MPLVLLAAKNSVERENIAFGKLDRKSENYRIHLKCSCNGAVSCSVVLKCRRVTDIEGFYTACGRFINRLVPILGCKYSVFQSQTTEFEFFFIDRELEDTIGTKIERGLDELEREIGLILSSVE